MPFENPVGCAQDLVANIFSSSCSLSNPAEGCRGRGGARGARRLRHTHGDPNSAFSDHVQGSLPLQCAENMLSEAPLQKPTASRLQVRFAPPGSLCGCVCRARPGQAAAAAALTYPASPSTFTSIAGCVALELAAAEAPPGAAVRTKPATPDRPIDRQPLPSEAIVRCDCDAIRRRDACSDCTPSTASPSPSDTVSVEACSASPARRTVGDDVMAEAARVLWGAVGTEEGRGDGGAGPGPEGPCSGAGCVGCPVAQCGGTGGVRTASSLRADKCSDPYDPRPRGGYLVWDDYFMAIAFLSAQRSKDPNKQVGACIVSPGDSRQRAESQGGPGACLVCWAGTPLLAKAAVTSLGEAWWLQRTSFSGLDTTASLEVAPTSTSPGLRRPRATTLSRPSTRTCVTQR